MLLNNQEVVEIYEIQNEVGQPIKFYYKNSLDLFYREYTFKILSEVSDSYSVDEILNNFVRDLKALAEFESNDAYHNEKGLIRFLEMYNKLANNKLYFKKIIEVA